MIIQPQLNF